ncbi:MAG: hypothetical protein QM702_21550 [Rubrivivax sp.]
MRYLRQGLAVLLALATAECVTRQVQFAPRVLDERIGFVVPAGSRTRWAVEGNGTGHYDATGVRRAGGGQGPTVLVVGDSFTEALHVDDDETFVARAESEAQRAGAPCRLLNVGIAGERTPIYVEHAPVYLARYSPSWTVVVLDSGDLTTDMFVQNATYFSGGMNGEPLELHPVPVAGQGVSARWRQAKTNSALLQRTALQGVGFMAAVQGTRLFRSGTEVPAAPPPNPADYPVAGALDALFAAYDERLTVVYLSQFKERSQVDAVEETAMAHCRAKRRSCVALREEFPAFFQTGGAPYGHPNKGFNVGHLNAVGHAAVGRVLARELKRIHDDGLF